VVALGAIVGAGSPSAAGGPTLCRSSQVSVRAVLAGTTQSLLGTFAVRNKTRRPCLVRGHPAVLIFDASGHRLRIRRFVQDKGDSSPLVRLSGNGRSRAAFTAQWFNFCGRKRGTPALWVALPGSRVRIAVRIVSYTPPGNYPACGDRHLSSHLGITHLRRPLRPHRPRTPRAAVVE
jgi:hypothetical protein